MITKISLIQIPAKAYQPDKFEQGGKENRDLASKLEKAAGLMSYLNQHPKCDVRRSIGIFYPPEQVTVKELTKKRRYYYVPFMYIHEEDK